jgi:CRP/FNR family transcriptional regulator, nitrogen fixation regulation protein
MLSPFIERSGILRSYARKSEIVGEDDPARYVYEVVSGTVCTCKMLREGRRQISSFYFSGDVFGLENTKTHNVAAQAITDVTVRVIKNKR